MAVNEPTSEAAPVVPEAAVPATPKPAEDLTAIREEITQIKARLDVLEDRSKNTIPAAGQ